MKRSPSSPGAVFVLVVALAMDASPFALALPVAPGRSATQTSHVEWVEAVMKRMETITAGMTRRELLQVFTTEGGLSTGLQRTFVSRDCPVFKVDVEFKAVGRPNRDAGGRVTLVEDPSDRIVKVSRPYLQRVNVD